MTTDTVSRSRGAFRPSFALLVPPSQQRAQGMPGARCARSRVCDGRKQKSTRVSQVTPESPGIPYAMVLTASFVLSPATGLSCHRHPRIESANLTPASGRQDHTTSPAASAPFGIGASTSTASHPASVTIANRPSVGQDVRIMPITSAQRGRGECRAPDAPTAACARVESKKHTR